MEALGHISYWESIQLFEHFGHMQTLIVFPKVKIKTIDILAVSQEDVYNVDTGKVVDCGKMDA